MSISLNANFELLSAGLYLDARQQFNTIIEMKDFAETSIPDGFITYNKETQKHYVFDSSNTVDATLGKWREYNSGGGSSEKQIKDWVSGSSYLKGDYIYHEGELYRCLASNSDVDFDEANWEQLTYGIDELTKEDVERLLGLTEEEIETMADLISDTEVRIDKTYSSSKIYTDIQQCLEDSKTYTLEEIARASTASYKVVTDVADMTEEKYLYLLYDGTTNYDIYIVETDGTPTKIGNTQIDLSNYYTKTEIDNDFLKKVDADGKYATITTVDGKVDKDKIVTVLDDTVTDEQVASAKATYDLAKQVNSVVTTEIAKVETELKGNIKEINDSLVDKANKSYVDDNLGELESAREIILESAVDLNTLLENGIYIPKSDTIGNNCTNIPTTPAYTFALKIYGGSVKFQEFSCTNGTFKRKHYNGAWQGDWKELATMDNLNYSTGANVPKTTITPVFPNGVTVASGGATINYVVKNGWCNVDFVFNISKATALTWNDIATGLPKPANNVNIVLINDGGKTYRPIPIKINSTGSLSLRVPNDISASDWWAGNVSYPVAE